MRAERGEAMTRHARPAPRVLHRRPDDIDPKQLLHELEIYRVELQMQNEELRVARAASEAALVRYMALFDFAPLGYVVLGADETVREVNHAAARLLGEHRSCMTGKSLETFVVPSDRPVFRRLLAGAQTSGATHSADVELSTFAGGCAYVALSAVALSEPEPSTLLTMEVIEQRASTSWGPEATGTA
jgi:PAS domain S-box-containing protein